MGHVFQLVEQYNALMQEIEELGEEITPEIAEQLNIKEEELATKVRAYYFVIKTAEGQIQLAKDEQERLMSVRKSKEGLIKRLKKTVDLAVETFGIIKPKAVGKSLDLGDLKVWQKKTVAMEIMEGAIINDARFCSKLLTITLSYSQVVQFYELIKDFDFIKENLTENNFLNKDTLKEWLIENEDYIKEVRNLSSEITNIEFEREVDNQIEKDTAIALATQLNHNSTVVFK
jgi:hypothetical protein